MKLEFRFYDSIQKKMIYQDPTEAKDVIFRKWETTPKCSRIMQFTGLLDKNGNKIFDGDVLMNSEVYWSEDWAMFALRGHHMGALMRFASLYKVVGNVYDNPELIPA